MQTIQAEVQQQDEGQRLDLFIAAACGLSRAISQQLIQEGHVLVNGRPAAKSYRLAAGDALQITVPPPADSHILPQEIPLDIVYEDRDLLVVNKPKGMVVHPAPGNPDGTLVNALLFHCGDSLSGIGGEIRPGIVHRIDKDTSGLLVVAKHDLAHQKLAEQFAVHSIHREYQAVVYGGFDQESGTVDAPIGRSKVDRKKMAVTGLNSKRAVTHFQVVARYPGFTHVKLTLQTGRTHQIRVHMAKLGHPVAGDPLYGPKKVLTSLSGQCLHAGELGFQHPVSGRKMIFTSELPAYFTEFLEQIEKG